MRRFVWLVQLLGFGAACVGLSSTAVAAATGEFVNVIVAIGAGVVSTGCLVLIAVGRRL